MTIIKNLSNVKIGKVRYKRQIGICPFIPNWGQTHSALAESAKRRGSLVNLAFAYEFNSDTGTYHRPRLEEWVKENMKGKVLISSSNVKFERKDDALLFLLRFS